MRTIGRLIATTAVAVAMTTALVAAPAHAGAGRWTDRHSMFRATNVSRGRFSRLDVGINRVMSKVALEHSRWMANTGKLEHTSNPAAAYLKGMPWHCWGENIAVSGGTVADVEKAFMASPEHRANILNSCFKHVAIGATRVNGALWVTVFFYG
ncbi:MAG TPA: CAP domain-containing protein [Actinomycetota bacterium]|jgi:uncharacterized protein YkwD|nr:CAP domain-containing protein [Actinomycetota bacterium]